MDGTTGEQVAVKNLILQICDCHVLEGDDKGRLEIATSGTGTGYYITNGTYVPITWSKEDKYAPVHYYYEDGTEVLLNQGKSFICVIEQSDADSGAIEIYDADGEKTMGNVSSEEEGAEE